MRLRFANCISHNQRPLWIISRFGADMLHPVLPVGTEKIESQAVQRRVAHFDKAVTQAETVGWTALDDL